jgi:hypothetical protein
MEQTYCERNGITPHKFKPDPNSCAWNMLLGSHKLCKVCGHSWLYIAHNINQQAVRESERP